MAPSIFPDSKRQIEFITYQSKGEKKIRPYSIVDLISYLEKCYMLYDNSLVYLTQSSKICSYVDDIVARKNGDVDILYLMKECINEFGTEYGNMEVKDWYNVIASYVFHKKINYNICDRDRVNYPNVAELFSDE